MTGLIGEFSALLTAALWSCSSLFFAAATARVGSFRVNVSRLLIAALLLGVLLAIARPVTELSTRQGVLLALSGIIGLAAGDSFLFRAYQDLGPRVTMLIMSLAPAFAVLLGYGLLGETLVPQAILGIIVTITGIGLVLLRRPDGGSTAGRFLPAGVFSALLAALGQAGALVLAKLAFNEGHVNGFFAAFVRILASLSLLIPLLIVMGRWKEPYTAFRKDHKALALTFGGSVFGPVLGISFSLIAVTYTKVAIAATLMATVPIMMLPLVRLIHKEALTWKAIAGAFLTVGGVALIFLR